MNEVMEIPIEQIKVGEHDQRLGVDEEAVADLAGSIARVGLLYPCLVVQDGEEYLVLDGHTRLAALKRLGRASVRCIVQEGDKAGCAEMAFAGNFFHKQLTPIERAAAIADVYKSSAMTIEQIADGFHRTVHWVEQQIAICDWPADVQCAIHETGLSVAAASNLAFVTDDVYRSFLLQNAVDQGATARTTSAWLQAWRSNMPQTEAVQTEPVAGQQPQAPLIPQSPCFICSNIFDVNQMSHVPMCGSCIGTIRSRM